MYVKGFLIVHDAWAVKHFQCQLYIPKVNQLIIIIIKVNKSTERFDLYTKHVKVESLFISSEKFA
jgi:hypothetical protein